MFQVVQIGDKRNLTTGLTGLATYMNCLLQNLSAAVHRRKRINIHLVRNIRGGEKSSLALFRISHFLEALSKVLRSHLRYSLLTLFLVEFRLDGMIAVGHGQIDDFHGYDFRERLFPRPDDFVAL